MKLCRAKLALIVWVGFLVGLVLLADTGHGRRLFALAQLIPGGDKVGHGVLFGMLSLLVNHVLRVAEVRLGKFTILKGSAMVTILVTLEECSQLFFASRTFDLIDLASDIVGIVVGGYLAKRYAYWKEAKLAVAIVRKPQS